MNMCRHIDASLLDLRGDQYQVTTGILFPVAEEGVFADVARFASFDSWFSVLIVDVVLASGSFSSLGDKLRTKLTLLLVARCRTCSAFPFVRS